MVDINDEINKMAAQHSVNPAKTKSKILNYFVSNKWFGCEPQIINKKLFVTEKWWNKQLSVIENFCINSDETAEQKHEKLMNEFKKELPKTYELLKRFVKGTPLSDNSIYTLADFLLYFLPGEIDFSSDHEMDLLMLDAEDHLKRTDLDNLIAFVNWLSANRSITTAFNKAYTVNQQKKVENNDAYDKNFYLKLVYHLFNQEYIRENEMYKKAAESKVYIDAWLFMSLHFICALRTTDLKRLPHPILPLPPQDVLEKVIQGQFKDEDARKTLLSIQTYLDAAWLTPNKTKEYQNVPIIHFHVPADLEVHFGTLFAIAEAHFQLSKSSQDAPLIHEIREYRDIKKAMGNEIGNLFLTTNFHCRQANKSFMQMVEAMTNDVVGVDDEFNMNGYIFASRARSHKGSFGEFAKTTYKYLRDQKMTGYTPESVFYELAQRGVLSNIVTMLLKMLCNEDFKKLSVEQQTKAINECELTPLEVENSVSVMQQASSEAVKNAIEICQTTDKNEILVILHRLGNDEAPSKTRCSSCLMTAMRKGCPYPERSTCIGCEHEVDTKATIMQLAAMTVNLKNQFQGAVTPIEKARLKAIIENVVAPKLKETLSLLRQNYGQDEFQTYLNAVKEVIDSAGKQ